MIVMPTTYSPSTIARSFKLVDEFELSGRVLHVIFDSQTPAIIEADIETFDGVPGIGLLLPWIYNVKRIWVKISLPSSAVGKMPMSFR
jgi:hypothetical protein